MAGNHEPYEWYEVCPRLSEFLDVMLHVEAGLGVTMPICCSAVVTPGMRRTLDAGFRYVGEVNALRAYNRPGAAVCLVEWDDDWRILVGATSPAVASELERDLGVKWDVQACEGFTGVSLMLPDAHAEMLELAVRLAEREAAGGVLSDAERTVSDIMWMGAQVSPNGFDGWLYETPCDRIVRTLDALARVGCTEVAEIAREALRIAGVDPRMMTDAERKAAVDDMSGGDRGRLESLDARFQGVYESSMGAVRRFARGESAE